MFNLKFDFFSNRLTFIDVTTDQLMNFNLWLNLNVFENHVYGVSLQYNRVLEDLKIPREDYELRVPIPQAGLDIYYYIMTWDKLKKILEKIKNLINRIQKSQSSLPQKFISEYREWKRRIDHLFTEFDDEIRNEYEHPSLEPYIVGNIQMWGNIISDLDGNIKAHVGKDRFVSIKKEHSERMLQLRIDLFDLFIKYFSQKPLTQELVKIRDYLESNIEEISNELSELKTKKDWENYNDLFNQVISLTLYLSKESIKISDEVRNKIFTVS